MFTVLLGLTDFYPSIKESCIDMFKIQLLMQVIYTKASDPGGQGVKMVLSGPAQFVHIVLSLFILSCSKIKRACHIEILLNQVITL